MPLVLLIGTVVKLTPPAEKLRRRSASALSSVPDSWSSASTARVATSRKPLSRDGLSSVPLLSALRAIEAMKACWRLIRSMSPLGRPLRWRTNASACSPRTTCRPALRSIRESRLLDVVEQADLDAAELLDHLLEAREVDLQVVVDPDPGEVLDRRDEQRGAAGRHRGVDLVLALGVLHPVAGSVYAGIVT